MLGLSRETIANLVSRYDIQILIVTAVPSCQLENKINESSVQPIWTGEAIDGGLQCFLS